MEGDNQKWLIALGVAIIISLIVSLIGLFLVLNQNNILRQEIDEITKKQNQQDDQLIQLSNPASVYCEEQGGMLEIITTSDGSQSGVCKFSDGSECEEWAFFRGECRTIDDRGEINSDKLVSIDSNWNLYTNNNLGFSIKVPKKVTTNNKTIEDFKIIEFGNLVYLTYDSKFSFNEIQNRLSRQISEDLSDTEMTKGIPWGMIIKNVNNEQELDVFIKERYGSGCFLGDKKDTDGDGTYDVKIKGDGLDLGKTKCPINFIISLKYSPEMKKVAVWDQGHDYNFGLASSAEGVDTEMADSFKFIK